MAKVCSPCVDCTDRAIGCHGKCKRYIEWDSENKRKRNQIYKARLENIQQDNYVIKKSIRLSKGGR